MSERNSNETQREGEVEEDTINNNSNYKTAATWIGAAVAGVAALGSLYWAASSRNKQNNQPTTQPAKQKSNKVNETQLKAARVNDSALKNGNKSAVVSLNQIDGASTSRSNSSPSIASGLINLLSSVTMASNPMYDKVATKPAPEHPIITNLNGLLSDIYVRYVQIKNDDFHRHYSVFDKFFQHLHKKMKEMDPYYGKYSSMAQFAGSHYDNLRIKSADEFDMDIVINLCLCLKENLLNPAESDIVLQHQSPGFVQLKMGTQYQNLPMRDKEQWEINKTAYKWKDHCNYLLRSKFIDWFKSVVNKALNTLPVMDNAPVFYIHGVPYTIYKSESGPSMTLFIVNKKNDFKLDVDLVPALKFPEERWPICRSYRHIPVKCRKLFWMVVGKPDKTASEIDQTRSWRIALHYQERDLIHNCYNLKTTLRLIKLLRDSLDMKKIASYYIKTLFLLEVVERRDRNFWRKSPAELFKLMVNRLHSALVKQEIPYFWNKNNNLIKNIDSRSLFNYAASLVPLIQVLEDQTGDSYVKVAKYLLTPQQFSEYDKKILRS